MAFTESIVRSLVKKGSGGKDLHIWDKQTHPESKQVPISGFYLRITPKNKCVWMLQYQVHEQDSTSRIWRPTRKYRKIKLGDYPQMSLLEARDRANELKRLVQSGVDPQARTPMFHQYTLRDWIEGWDGESGYLEIKRLHRTRSIDEVKRRIYKHMIYDKHLSPHACDECGSRGAIGPCDRSKKAVDADGNHYKKKNPKTGRPKWVMDKCVGEVKALEPKPTLGDMELNDITRGDIQSLHNRIGKVAPIEANRVLARLKDIFGVAKKHQRFTKSDLPTDHVDKFPERSRERILGSLGNPYEMAQFMRTVHAEGDHYFEAYVYLLLFTGLRIDEARTLMRQDVDLENRIITVQRVQAKNRTTLHLPINDGAYQVLSQIQVVRGSMHVFPRNAGVGGPVKNWEIQRPPPKQCFDKAWNRVRDKMGIRYDYKDEEGRLVEARFTWHDLRRTFGSTMALDSPIEIIGKALNQKHPSATAVYTRIQTEGLREAVDKAGDRIRQQVGRIKLTTPKKTYHFS